MKKNNIGMTVGIAVVVGALCFFGGMKFADYQKTQMRANGNRQFQGALPGSAQTGNGQGQMKNGLGGRPVIGEVISKDEKSITVKTQDSGSRIIILSSSTTFSKTAEGSLADVVVGTQVGVFGTENTDKSITAQTIQLDPKFTMGNGSSSK